MNEILGSIKFIMKKTKFFSFKLLVNERISPLIVLVLFCFREAWVNRFYLRFYKDIPYVTLRDRVEKSKNLSDDFIIKSDGFNKLKEINIVMRGDSLMNHEKEINYNYPTFYVNTYKKMKGDRIIYISGDCTKYEEINSLGLYPSVFIGTGVEKDDGYSCLKNKKYVDIFSTQKKPKLHILHKLGVGQLGSGLASIACLESFSEKVNIYGFDEYFDDYLSNKSFFQCLLSIYKIPAVDYNRMKLISAKFINLYYVGIMIESEKFNIRSFLKDANSQKNLLYKIDTMFSRRS